MLLFSVIGCEKDNIDNQINKEDIFGKWLNIVNNKDTLYINDTIIIRIDTTTMLPKHRYSYTLYEDSIKIMYIGEYYIYCLESSHKIALNKNKFILSIENLSGYFPEYEGNKFEKIANEN